MLWKIVKKDVARSKLICVALTAFICAAALLLSLAAALAIRLSGAVDALMTAAVAPDLMQMHAGEVDMARLARFASDDPRVKAQQTLAFLNIDGGAILLGEHSLADSVQDNGLCTQSEGFDYLLGEDGAILHPDEGEIYLPVCYRQDAAAGDPISVCGRELTVAGYLRDAQMESSFASSKRFLVNEKDYAALKDEGTEEYLIEFLLYDRAQTGEVQAAYAAAGLEANGPAVTYSLFRMLNVLSGGVLAGAILLMSACVVAVALLCIRFTLLTKLSDDAREIGVMRALGLSRGDIAALYLGKYAVIAAAGCVLGVLLSLPASRLLIERLHLYLGGETALALPLLLALLLFALCAGYVRGVLRKSLRLSPAALLRSGGETEGGKGLRLSRLAPLGANVYLALNDLCAQKKQYATFLLVLTLAAFIVIVPQNLYATVSSESFIGYMGTGLCDMRIDLQQGAALAKEARAIQSALVNDPDIEQYALYTTRSYALVLPDGSRERIAIDLGPHALFPAQYAQGHAPEAADEIALSSLQSDALTKTVGDTLTILSGDMPRKLTVCGVYADVTNGGKTAKAVFADETTDVMRYMVSADFAQDKANTGIKAYQAAFPNAKVSDVQQYVSQTLSGSIGAMRTAARAALFAALLVASLITALFLRMLLSKDARDIGVLRALGFQFGDIRAQYLCRAFVLTLLAFLLGTLLANTLGERLAGMLIASLGATGLRFSIDPLKAYLLCPALLSLAVLASAMLSLVSAGRIPLCDYVRNE